MKTKVTKKQVMSYNSNVLAVGYCGLQSLLSRFSPQYYTCGVYGWNADIYEIDNMCICTGYRPFGNIKLDYKELDRVNKEYEVMKENNPPYEEEINEVKKLLKSLFTR